MNTEKIGNFIKQKRQEKKLTQKDIATKLNITDRAISKWERGLGCPDVSLLEDLSNILEVSILELLNGEELQEEIKNKHLINSINYSKENFKLKIRNNLNVIITFIIIIVLSLLIILNISNYYKLNKKYEFSNIEIGKDVYDKYYNIILSNQGKYSDSDYKEIISYVKKSKINLDKLYSYYDKKYITMKDYYKFIDKYKKDLDVYYLVKQNNVNSPYHTLIKYDTSDYTINNMLKYSRYTDQISLRYSHIKTMVNDGYKYNFNDTNLYMMESFIFLELTTDSNLFENIIKVGELNEK